MTTENTSRNTPDRMDLPFVGLATFARQPACPDWDKLDGTGPFRVDAGELNRRRLLAPRLSLVHNRYDFG